MAASPPVKIPTCAVPTSITTSSRSRSIPSSSRSEIARNRMKPALIKEKIRLDGIKTAESPVMTGLVEGPGQTVMSWQPYEMKGVETPPNRPGMAIIKRVSATEAEPGDTLTFTITYRNMGNTPIRAATIVDSLLPRLEYVKGSAKGPREPSSRRPRTASARPS